MYTACSLYHAWYPEDLTCPHHGAVASGLNTVHDNWFNPFKADDSNRNKLTRSY
ncbi:predicted protein [Plenodomus lingam JN3]|uniref:Predicted protein n=1 Tax=Leptosphaeria maculans (strain JN3 / isolate v23.1.3 / race Av1-4-5-6-7-8) TaxID=985895 RepID=E4ZW36_LEPMJ|nr:predicted protein [Plenodomus lingam JN3]CBX95812.1 predicted protein [Plenodomus lingam JN3]